ncbi:MAG: alpha-isopropylmalate/homocitrate synthase family transferase [Ignavibacteria bacterium]|nr:MAG: alpha-isopropylmalate/homocitrate synthase family transferase [Ignavibacteria bacterium]KAF0157458.1 MAG: alpha-isopropylmalate/homocitrate synthase family transferase [Ignavibacteria bacterium]
MKTKLIELFDTTLRDGTQGEAVSLTVRDKIIIAKKLDDFGIDIIEGGWPGSNPRDADFFQKIKKVKLHHAQMCAFGSTARYLNKIETDANLIALLEAETPYVSIFGKTWKFHSEKSLGLTEEQNAELIYKSVKFLNDNGRKVIFDAEHFFDGYKDDPRFAIRMLKSAQDGGADVITLCDTNGGALQHEIKSALEEVKKLIYKPIGIHVHNDGDLAVANSLTAVECGATHVQGTINGVGERCGNANLVSIIPNLLLKMNCKTKKEILLTQLTSLSNSISEIMNLNPNTRAAFVGKSAFAHKGGVHVSAVIKDSRMYEHINPAIVGNAQRVLVSDLSGQSNIKYKAKEFGVDVDEVSEFNKKLVKHIKELEYEGYQFDGAEASFELILRSETNEFTPFFKAIDSRIYTFFDEDRHNKAEAVLKIEVNGEVEHTAAEGDGPVNALDNALRKALMRFYPEIAKIKLVDYKVRVLDEKDATAAKVRVLIESSDGESTWSTVGVSTNIIEASWQALCDGLNYKLFKNSVKERIAF